MAINLLFNDGWHFTKQEIDTPIDKFTSDEITWNEIDIPHDWLIYDANNLYETSEGWYKKDFMIEDLDKKSISIRFEGVYMNTFVYINGELAGEWKYGYSTFEFDITNFLKVGQNTINVVVKHESPNSRWYSGAGIYRNVWLKTRALTHIVPDGIYFSTTKLEDAWKVEIETEVASKGDSENAVVLHTMIDKDGAIFCSSQNKISTPSNVQVDKQEFEVKSPAIWSIDEPNLYKLKTEIIVDGEIVDVEVQNIGFRTFHFDTDEGFFLNGEWVKLHGVCLHHDLGSLGAAVNKEALRRQLEIMIEMGVNSVRTSHNMPAVELMELADEMGILINSEAFDMWELPKTEYDYARFFNDWAQRDVASWIRRDRNHPSVIMWSIGNEIYDTHAGPRGLEITKMLKQFVLDNDPKQNAMATIGSNYIAWEGAQECADELTLSGYNYGEHLYDEHHEKYPHWYIYGSETASRVQSRGIYHFPASTSVMTYDDLQCSSLENCKSGNGDRTAQTTIIQDRDAKFCAGQYIWTGFDYIGEPTPYFTKNSYFGQVDTAGFEKDSFYLYQSAWTDYKDNPMVHLFPYWDFNEGQIIDIMAYSNAPKVELFFNGESLGVCEIDHKKGKKLNGSWQMPYQKGVLKAVAYDEDGNIIAEDEQRSFGDGTNIVLKPNKTQMNADGEDLIFVEISTEDDNGTFVANARNRMEVIVEGAGRLIGLDNGDSTDYDEYKGTSRKLFSGKLLAIIAAKLDAGDIDVKVKSVGFDDAELTLKALPCEVPIGVSANTENEKSAPNSEVPVRKIELIRKGTNKLGKDNMTTVVKAELLPANATHTDLTWKVVTNSGIETNVATIDADGDTATINAVGDGHFRLRCSCNNGMAAPEVLSELEFEISGLGQTTINPYEFIPASLYNASNLPLDEVLRGGIAAAKEPTHIGFRNVDFGKDGSDEITIPIIRWFKNDPTPIQIWEGMPGEDGAEILYDGEYQADFVWQTYVPNTFKLAKRLTGIRTICIVVSTDNENVFVHGFKFTPSNKAYEKLSSKDNSRIYGDSFVITEQAIEKIGNNVYLEFDDMNFDKGVTKITICGKTRNEKDTIHIRFTSEDSGEINHIAEFSHSDNYEEKEFSISGIDGNQTVKFTFLPGCNFDFKWFKFE